MLKICIRIIETCQSNCGIEKYSCLIALKCFYYSFVFLSARNMKNYWWKNLDFWKLSPSSIFRLSFSKILCFYLKFLCLGLSLHWILILWKCEEKDYSEKLNTEYVFGFDDFLVRFFLQSNESWSNKDQEKVCQILRVI